MDHVAVFTGSHLVVWGGDDAWPSELDQYAPVEPHALATGGRFDVDSGAWSPTEARGAPEGVYATTAIWTGTEMVVWGGYRERDRPTHSGARYDPSADRWRTMTRVGAPGARARHTVVWTGTEALVWGGQGADGLLADGGRYDPARDAWTTISEDGAPTARISHTAVWSGTEMIVWGGRGEAGERGDGARYDPVTDTWRRLSTHGGPSMRGGHVAVWTGAEMVVWGGATGSWEHRDRSLKSDGAIYSPATDTWRGMTNDDAFARESAEAVWTGTHVAVLGECEMDDAVPYPPPNLGLYDPRADTWILLGAYGTTDRPLVLGDGELLVWGGTDGTNIVGDGVRIPLPTPE